MKKRNLLIILILTILVLYYSLKDNFKEILYLLLNVDLKYILLSYLLVLSYTFFKTIITNNIINSFKPFSFLKTFKLQIMTFFFNAITPFSSGGQPFQIYTLKKDKINVSTGTSIITQESILHQASLIIVCLLMVIINIIFKIYELNNFAKMFLSVGLFVNILLLILYFLLAYNKKIDKSLLNFVASILLFLKIIKNKEETLNNWHLALTNFQNGSKKLLENKLRFIKLLLLNCFSLICLYLVPLTILYSFNNFTAFDGVISIMLTCFVSVISCYIPLPGGTVGNEYFFILLFSTYINNPLLNSLMIMWRFLTYYLPLIIGLIVFDVNQKNILK